MRWKRCGRVRPRTRPHRRRLAIAAAKSSVCSLVLSLTVVLVFSTASASAEPVCTDTWTGPSEAEWTIAGDWSTGKVPTSSDDACIGSGKTVEVTGSVNQTGVVQDAGMLVIRGTLEVANTLEASSIASLSIKGGKLTGAGEVQVTGSFIGSGSGARKGPAHW
jgi:hypothetical protein